VFWSVFSITLSSNVLELADRCRFEIDVVEDEAPLGAVFERFYNADGERCGCLWECDVGEGFGHECFLRVYVDE